jgi:hypothetical protein
VLNITKKDALMFTRIFARGFHREQFSESAVTRFTEEVERHPLVDKIVDMSPENVEKFLKNPKYKYVLTSNLNHLKEKIELLVPFYLSRNILGERLFPNISSIVKFVLVVLEKSTLFLYQKEVHGGLGEFKYIQPIELNGMLDKIANATSELPYVSKFHGFTLQN